MSPTKKQQIALAAAAVSSIFDAAQQIVDAEKALREADQPKPRPPKKAKPATGTGRQAKRRRVKVAHA